MEPAPDSRTNSGIAKRSLAIGVDFGTNSCRSLLVDVSSGEEISSHVFSYPSGELGILLDDTNPLVARQNPADYLQGLETVTRGALEDASLRIPDFEPEWIVGIGVDTTGSTVIPIDERGLPLGLNVEFQHRLDAQVWLWRDHTAHAEAAEITALAREIRPQYLAKCGGVYSSEWWWSKILRLRRTAPDVFAAAHTFAEHCDWIPALLTGNDRPATWKRSVCAAGHKAMFSETWGGLPDDEFLARLHPDLAPLRARLYDTAHPSTTSAGGLCAEWASRTGLAEGIPVAVGAFDAHMGAVGAGVKEGVLVKILGTSTCDITVTVDKGSTDDIPGVCGIVPGSVLPGHLGIEAGQSAVGDLFLWLTRHLTPQSYGETNEARFAALEGEIADLAPGESGLLALDWNNGNRTVLVDSRLSGLLIGQTLHTTAAEIYRALIEATAFGALRIIEQIERHGVPIHAITCTGGLAAKNPALMQIYADVTGRVLRVARSDQTCALGAALFAAAAAGTDTLERLQSTTTAFREREYRPNPPAQAVYRSLYSLYRTLHDAFGTQSESPSLHGVMKQLLDLKEQAAGSRESL